MTVTHRAPAVSRAIDVLKLLGRSNEPMGVNAIARELDVVPSSCLHILRALSDDGLVQADPKTKQYTLGLGLLALAHDMLGRNRFAQMVQPELDALAHKYGVTATAVELDGLERMVVVAMAQARATTILKIHVGLGSRFPAFISATGRCIAAHCNLSEADLKKQFAKLTWQSAPKFTDWLAEVKLARRNGVAVDIGNYISGFTVVAAPVINGPDLRRVVSVVGVSDQLSGRKLTGAKLDTKVSAERVAAKLAASR